jgi:hypothetical protein
MLQPWQYGSLAAICAGAAIGFLWHRDLWSAGAMVVGGAACTSMALGTTRR